MKYTLYFTIQICAVIALVTSVACNLQWYWILICAIVLATSFILAYNAVAKPLHTIQNGLYLLQEQDFTSSLRTVGQADADKVVKLFNGLMASMKAERLKNLEQNAFLEKLVDASPMGIAICDYDGNIVQTNRSFDIMSNDDINTLLRGMHDGEAQVIRSGQAHILRCSRLSFMSNGFKRPFYMIERLTDEILKAETAIFNKIVRTMGHEVNNSLGSVISVLQSIEDLHSDDEVITSTIDSSIDSCNRLCAFVKGYADVVKLPEPTLVQTDVNAMIMEALPSLKHLAPNSIDISVKLSVQPIYVSLDAMLFERVLINIVKNAIESIGSATGHIEISTESHSIRISDNGRGISAENAQKLFTPFFSTKHPDHGLGLMLIADILRKHNFEYSLTTDSETHLTTFAIAFHQNKIL